MANNKSILEQAESLFNVKAISENTIGNSANLIFEVEIAQAPFMLRVSEYSEKKESHIDFELKWINYLADNLGSIAKPVKSADNSLYEVMKVDDKSYIVCLFEKANGKVADINNTEEFNEDLFFNLGALMGNMHRLTTEYGGNLVMPEFEWYNSTSSWPEYNVILDEDVQPFEKRFFNEIYALPISKNSYGIIHDDIHTDNFFVNNGCIKLFDFDDCKFCWYASDIASTLFFIVQAGVGPLKNKNEKERTEFAESYLLSYLKGYTQTNTVSKYWISKYDLFMRYRMTRGYKFVQNNWKGEAIHPHQRYLDWHKNRIINDLPYVFIDYEKVVRDIPSIRTL